MQPSWADQGKGRGKAESPPTLSTQMGEAFVGLARAGVMDGLLPGTECGGSADGDRQRWGDLESCRRDGEGFF